MRFQTQGLPEGRKERPSPRSSHSLQATTLPALWAIWPSRRDVARVTSEQGDQECVDNTIQREFEGRSQSRRSLSTTRSARAVTVVQNTRLCTSTSPSVLITADPTLVTLKHPTFPYTMMGVAVRSVRATAHQLNVWLGNGVNTRLNAESLPDMLCVDRPTSLLTLSNTC